MKDKADKESRVAEKMEKKQKQQVGEMSFLEHLEELRWHIIRSFLAIFIFSVVAFIFQDFIFEEIIFKPKSPDFFTNRMFARLGDWLGSESIKINQQELQLININLAGQFTMSMWTALVAGLIVGSPVIFSEFWKFIKPALYEHERRVASGAVIYTTFLFVLGLMFGYYLIVPLSTQFFGTYSISKEVLNQINITSYISMVVSVVFASGVIFLLPVFSYSLSKVGILTPSFMRKYRKHAIVVMFLMSAIITPPDIFSQVLVAIPLLTLYEVSIFISGRVEKTRLKKEHART